MYTLVQSATRSRWYRSVTCECLEIDHAKSRQAGAGLSLCPSSFHAKLVNRFSTLEAAACCRIAPLRRYCNTCSSKCASPPPNVRTSVAKGARRDLGPRPGRFAHTFSTGPCSVLTRHRTPCHPQHFHLLSHHPHLAPKHPQPFTSPSPSHASPSPPPSPSPSLLLPASRRAR